MQIHVDSLFAHDLHLPRWNARGVQRGRIKIEIKTGSAQIVSHSYELHDYRAGEMSARGPFTQAGHVLWKNRPMELCPWFIIEDRLMRFENPSRMERPSKAMKNCPHSTIYERWSRFRGSNRLTRLTDSIIIVSVRSGLQSFVWVASFFVKVNMLILSTFFMRHIVYRTIWYFGRATHSKVTCKQFNVEI